MTTSLRPALLFSVALLLVVSSGSASAQATPTGIGNLQGLNVPQSAARTSIFSVCPVISGPNVFPTLNAAQQDLAVVCSGMVQNSAGGSGLGAGFQLADAQLAQALQTLAHEENAAQGRGLGESPGGVSGAIRSRLQAVRAAGSLVRLSGFQFNGRNVADADFLGNGRGGGAAAEPSGRLGAFVNASYHTGDRDASSREDEFDFDNLGLIAGVDYRFRTDLIGGVALNYSQTDVDIETAPGGDVETDTYGVSLYSTYYKGAFYLDAHANYSRSEFDIERRILIPSNNPKFRSWPLPLA